MTIREARENSNLSQAKTAKAIGVTTNGYQNYEYGVTVPNVTTALKLAKLFGTTVEELFGEKQTLK